MSIDTRRSAVALWAVWVVAGALGGVCATILALAGLVDLANRPDYIGVLGYFGAIAAASVFFQSLLLTFVAPGKGATVLFLVATVLGASFVNQWLSGLVFNLSSSNNVLASVPSSAAAAILTGAYQTTYPLAVGLTQGLVLAFVTGQKLTLPVWIVAFLIAIPVSRLFGYDGPPGADATFILASAISNAIGAAVTGLALVFILQLTRGRRERFAPKSTAALQGQG